MYYVSLPHRIESMLRALLGQWWVLVVTFAHLNLSHCDRWSSSGTILVRRYSRDVKMADLLSSNCLEFDLGSSNHLHLSLPIPSGISLVFGHGFGLARPFSPVCRLHRDFPEISTHGSLCRHAFRDESAIMQTSCRLRGAARYHSKTPL